MNVFKRIAQWFATPEIVAARPPEPPATSVNTPTTGEPVDTGLQKRWTPGEQLPWKGIWFEVAEVQPESILLKPVGTTWQKHKEITGRKRS